MGGCGIAHGAPRQAPDFGRGAAAFTPVPARAPSNGGGHWMEGLPGREPEGNDRAAGVSSGPERPRMASGNRGGLRVHGPGSDDSESAGSLAFAVQAGHGGADTPVSRKELRGDWCTLVVHGRHSREVRNPQEPRRLGISMQVRLRALPGKPAPQRGILACDRVVDPTISVLDGVPAACAAIHNRSGFAEFALSVFASELSSCLGRAGVARFGSAFGHTSRRPGGGRRRRVRRMHTRMTGRKRPLSGTRRHEAGTAVHPASKSSPAPSSG